MLMGLIDGDGYIAITKNRNYVRVQLILNLHKRELNMLKEIQSILKVGRVNVYPANDTVQYIISRVDLQEIIFPLMISHGLFFLTDIRRAQFDRAIFILQKDIRFFADKGSFDPEALRGPSFCNPSI
jgi:hypothetical protein